MTRKFLLALCVIFGVSASSASALTIESPHIVGSGGEPSYENGWKSEPSPYDGAQFWKDPSGIVHLQGVVQSGSVPSVVFTLPTGDRPTACRLFMNFSEGKAGAVQICPSGTVEPQLGGSAYFALDGITFRSSEGSSTWPTEPGPEGKEGKEGAAGKEGKEGPAGPAGTEGKGTMELVKFGGNAEGDLNELRETTELIGWCVIGTILACMIGFMLYTILKAGGRRS